jgi:hypothetical protein
MADNASSTTIPKTKQTHERTRYGLLLRFRMNLPFNFNKLMKMNAGGPLSSYTRFCLVLASVAVVSTFTSYQIYGSEHPITLANSVFNTHNFVIVIIFLVIIGKDKKESSQKNNYGS